VAANRVPAADSPPGQGWHGRWVEWRSRVGTVPWILGSSTAMDGQPPGARATTQHYAHVDKMTW